MSENSSLTGHQDIDQFLEECFEMMRRKGADYQQGNDDLLYQFRAMAADLDITPEKAWGVLFRKHLGAVWSYVKKGKTESESIQSRIKDLIVYLLLFYRMVSENH